VPLLLVHVSAIGAGGTRAHIAFRATLLTSDLFTLSSTTSRARCPLAGCYEVVFLITPHNS